MKKYTGKEAFRSFDLFDREQVSTYLELEDYELNMNDYCPDMTKEEFEKLEWLDEKAYETYVLGDELKKMSKGYSPENREKTHETIDQSIESLLKIIQREADDIVQFDYYTAQRDIEREKKKAEAEEKAHQAELNTWINW